MTDNRFNFAKYDDKISEQIVTPQYSYWKSVFRRFFSSKLAIFMLGLGLTVVLLAFIQPAISGYSPLKAPNINDSSKWFLKPNATYLFGTDDVGNSLFDAVWSGTKNSLIVSFLSTLITLVIGIIVGMFWGFSKKLDAIMIEVYNVISNIPTLLIAMLMVYTLGGGIFQLVFALTITSWIGSAYFIRVQVLIIRDREYNLASRCLGTSRWKMITHNIFPYLISVIMTITSSSIPRFISYEVVLSYLGTGLSAEYASLGKLIQNYAPHMIANPHIFWIPVLISAFISVSLYIVGQALADASDPRTHMI